MPDHLEPQTDRSAVIQKAWRKWFFLWLPLTMVGLVASNWVGFPPVMIALLVLLAVTLLYQRYAKRRSWLSILFGVYGGGQ